MKTKVNIRKDVNNNCKNSKKYFLQNQPLWNITNSISNNNNSDNNTSNSNYTNIK